MSVNTKVTVPEGCSTILRPTIPPRVAKAKRPTPSLTPVATPDKIRALA